MDAHHQYQIDFCKTAQRPILNIGSMHDPAKLGETYDAINTDIRSYDAHSNSNLKEKVRNFIQCNAFDLPFEDESFPTVVLGEYIEHCTYDAAYKTLKEAKRVLTKDGKILLTFPLDDRPKIGQHAPHLLVEWSEGITSWHSHVWENEELEKLFGELELKEIKRDKIAYGFAQRGGWGIVCEKLT